MKREKWKTIMTKKTKTNGGGNREDQRVKEGTYENQNDNDHQT